MSPAVQPVHSTGSAKGVANPEQSRSLARSADGYVDLMTIGQVIEILSDEFPDSRVTVSKIRFLESEGLIEPVRTPSRYRKFAPDHLDRLRYILTMQRDHYLPLNVIKANLERMDRGEDPLAPDVARNPGLQVRGDEAHVVPISSAGAVDAIAKHSAAQINGDSTFTLVQLSELTNLPIKQLAGLRDAGILKTVPRSEKFDGTALVIARLCGRLMKEGVDIRHIRPIVTAASRQVDLVEALVVPRIRSESLSADEVEQKTEDLVGQIVTLQATVMMAMMREVLQ